MNVISDYEYPLDVLEISGIGKAFTSIGYNFLLIKRKEKEILDAFAEKKPDIFITHISMIDRATYKAIKNNQNCKTFIYVEKENDLDKFKDFKNVFFISKQINKFSIFLPPSCDIYLCLKPELEESMISEICYIGNYKKDFVLNNFFNDFDVKCWGKTIWPFNSYLGLLKQNKLKNAIFSSKTSIYDDNCENKTWPLYFYMCNKPIINFKSIWLHEFLNKNSILINTEEELLNEIQDIIKDNNKHKENIETNTKNISNNHLCHNRVSAILDYADLKEDSLKCLNVAKEITKKYLIY